MLLACLSISVAYCFTLNILVCTLCHADLSTPFCTTQSHNTIQSRNTIQSLGTECGFYDTMHNNTVLDMGAGVGPDGDLTLEQRKHKAEHDLCVDSCYTSQPITAGKIRCLVPGAQLRFFTPETKVQSQSLCLGCEKPQVCPCCKVSNPTSSI